MFAENRLRCGRTEKIEKDSSLGIPAAGHDGCRIDDGGMTASGKFARDPDFLVRNGIGKIHNTKWHLTARYQRQRSAHIFRGRDFSGYGPPDP